MSLQTSQIAESTNRTFGKSFKFAAVTAAVIVTMFFTAGTAAAATNVNVVNTPTVNVGNTPRVSIANTPSVNIANTPAVSISGTPAVNANATITAPGPLTNVGRLASQHVTLQLIGSACATHLAQNTEAGGNVCFDISNHAGQALVITDVSFWGQTTPGTTCGMALLGPGGSNPFAISFGVADSAGIASKSEHLTTGVAMTGNPVVSNTCSAGALILMQGYLVPNQ